jgi:chromosome segregation ATPase
MTAADVQQLQYALSKAQERIEGLQRQVAERDSQVVVLTDRLLDCEAELATVTAERDVQQRRLDDIPMAAMEAVSNQTKYAPFSQELIRRWLEREQVFRTVTEVTRG